MWAPIVRIVLRYFSAGVLGFSLEHLAEDPDVVTVIAAALAAAVGVATEIAYALAKRRGWAT